MHKIVIVDDDADVRRIVELRLRLAGYQVFAAPDGETGLQLIRTERPHVVLLDLMMPRMHGFAVCQAIRSAPELQGIYVIVVSAKDYPLDIRKAKELGADLYWTKPYDLEALVKTIQQVMPSEQGAMYVKYWGTRGSIPTPGPGTMRYGGNTACTELRADGSVLLFDCGTGAREAGLALSREFEGRPLHVHLFVGHSHWDHIQGFPFFAPAYKAGNCITIYSLRGSDKSLEKVFTGQMDSSYFPVNLEDLKAELQFVELRDVVTLGRLKVSHVFLNHPGLAIGFRVDREGKSVVYLTDHEPYWRLSGKNDHSQKLDREIDQFAAGADLYIREGQYTEEEYPKVRGWGHSTWTDALDSANAAGVRHLSLYHHDPVRDDLAIDAILANCRTYMQEHGMTFECTAAKEGSQESV